jgi:GAF domain-containing protein
LGEYLPLELKPQRAVMIYLRRLAFILQASALIFLVLVMVGVLGPIGTLSVALIVAVLFAIGSLIKFRRTRQLINRNSDTRLRVTLVLLMTLPGVTAAAAALAAIDSGGSRLQYIFLAGTSSLGLALLGLLQALRADEATALWVGESRIAATLARTAHPMVTALGNVTASEDDEERRRHLEVLLAKAVGLSKAMTGRTGRHSSRTRSMFYYLERDDLLVLRQYVGDYGSPRKTFLASKSENDRRVIELAKADTALFIKNLDEASPAYFSEPHGRSYKTLISVPVRAGNRSFGTLMLDGEEPQSLTEVDVGYAVLIAGVMGAGLAAADASAGSIGPADVRYITETTDTFDSIFATQLRKAEVYFRLIPEEDRKFLESRITLHAYAELIQGLADRRAEGRLGGMARHLVDSDPLKRWLSKVGIAS